MNDETTSSAAVGSPAVVSAPLPLDALGEVRAAMPFLRDLRPELYGA